MQKIVFSAFLFLFSFSMLLGEIRPEWVGNTPKAGNDSYVFIEVTSYGSDLAGAKIEALKKLASDQQLKKSVRISVNRDKSRHIGQNFKNEKFRESIQDQTEVDVNISGDVYTLQANEVDSWSTQVPNGMVELHTLYQVAVAPNPTFDETYYSTKYGSAAVVRSLIPGWGQIYKGSKAKGWTIIGAEVAAIGGIIYTENQRSTYESKVNTRGITTNQLKTYKNKMDNFETARNVCIGAAAAIYIYNLVDAAVAPGARRVIVKPRRYAMGPYVTPEGGAGLSLAYTF